MSLLRDHFKNSFNIGYKLAKSVIRKNEHGQEVSDWEISGEVYDAYFSELRSQNPKYRVDTNDHLYLDIATHKIYTDISEDCIKVGDKIIMIWGRYDLEEYSVEFITPQWDENQKGIDHLILYVKNLKNVR